MTTRRRGSNAGIGKAGKPARADRAAQADAAREDEPLDEAGWTPDPRDGQDPCDEAPAAPDPAGAYERVLKDMTFAGASLEPDGFHPYDIAARGLRLILTAPEGCELANLREAFTPLAPLPFHVMVRAMELDWREREKGWRPNRPVVSRRFSELCNRGDTIGQMVARLVLLLPCYEVSPDSERGADPGLAPLDYLLYLLAVDVWRHPDCLALPPLAAPAPNAPAPDLWAMEDEDHERGFFREQVERQAETDPDAPDPIPWYRTKDCTSWLQFVQPQWLSAREGLLGWLLENLKGSYADRAAVENALRGNTLGVLLTELLERTFRSTSEKGRFAQRVFGRIQCFSEVLAAGGASDVPDQELLQKLVDEYAALHGKIRTRKETGRLTASEREWLHGLLRKIGLFWTGRDVAACLEAHGISLSARAIDEHRKGLRPGGQYFVRASDGDELG